jgi:hypothetical protein
MASVSFPALVNSAADYFQHLSLITVTDSGRQALIDPAMAYQEKVDNEIREKKITHGFLFETVLTVLQTGLEIARDQNRPAIDASCVVQSIKRKCPYLMWC